MLDSNIPEECREWDGWSFNDLTYSTTEKMYMQTMAFYNFKWKMTVPVMTTWLRGLTAIHYARHFDNFFKFNPDVLVVRGAEAFFQLMGFCMDFSDAQFIGLGVAYGKLVLRQVHKDQRHDHDHSFLSAARVLGDQFVKKYCKGCLFHYAQSVRRVSMHVHADEAKRAEFRKLAFNWQKAPVEATMGVQSATQVVAMIDSRFPEAKNWTKWWRKRAHLIMEADMSLHKPEDIMASYPTTDNNLESFHAHFGHAMPRRHLPLYLGVSMTYHYAEKCKTDAKAMQEGTRKQNRERGPQHSRKRLPIALRKDEWVERAPENARSLRANKKR
jgi:hypothetical protein